MTKSATVDRRTDYRHTLTSTQPVRHFFRMVLFGYKNRTTFYLSNGLSIITHKKVPKLLIIRMHVETVMQLAELR